MKKIILGVLFLGALSMPALSYAQGPFGGFEVAIGYCGCSGQSLHWFAPLYFDDIPITGALTYPIGTPTTFAGFLRPGAWALGLHSSGEQACWAWSGKFCFLVPSLGAITPFTGTSS